MNARFVSLLSLFLAAALGGGSALADLEIASSNVAGGGAILAGGTFELRGSAGSHDGRGALAGGAFEHDGGYWPGVCGSTIVSYGAGCPGSGGFVPQLSITGCTAAGDVEVLTISNALGSSQAFVMFGFGQASAPLGAGCFLRIAAPSQILIGPLPLFGAGAGGGAISLPVTLPGNLVSAIGISITHQAFVVDPSTPLGFVATNGAQTAIG
jgi:hypothetical protein